MIDSEKRYLGDHNMDSPPNCPMCGSPLKFKSYKLGYQKYCSRKCMSSDPKIKQKRRECIYKKYGCSSPFGSKDIQQKSRQIMLEKYGVDNPMKREEFRNKATETSIIRYGIPHFTNRQKSNATHMERYGGVGFAVGKISRKIKQTMLEKYGVNHNMRSDQIKTKVQNSFRDTFISKFDDLIGYNCNGDWICKCPHPECNKCGEKQYTIPNRLYYERKSLSIELCTKLLPKQPQWSSLELKIRSWLDEMEIGYVANDRRFGIEMDIYIPDLKLAIEVNGSYWHSTQFKSPSYHIQKSILLAENGIQCVFVWDDYLEEDIKGFLNAVIKGEELNPWKQKWFPDIDGWPVDFGLVDGDWKEHKTMHGANICYDSGYINLT